MIQGVGIDLCEIARMSKSLESPRFLERFFSEEERAYILSRGAQSAASAAGIFAAKEAFAKALGTGLAGLELRDIAVSHTELGAPYYAPTGEAACRLQGARAHLSVTHDAGVAAAVAIIETE